MKMRGITEVTRVLTATSATRIEIHDREFRFYGSNDSFDGYSVTLKQIQHTT